MFWFFYHVLFLIFLAVSWPRYGWRMWKRGGYRRGFMQRFGCYPAEAPASGNADGRRIWIHAVSVGEMFIALRLRDRLLAIWPDRHVVLTTNTSTGHALAAGRLSPRDTTLLYFPLDLAWTMRRAFRYINPGLIVLMECELWPVMLREAHRRKIPVAVVNARLSDRSFAGYRRAGFLFRRIAGLISAVYAQTERDAGRFRELGVAADRIYVAGNAKYDLAGIDPRGVQHAHAALQAAAITPESLVVLGGSTWPGEEDRLMEMLPRLRRAAGAPVVLVLVPRHVERRAAICDAAMRRKLRLVTRRQTRMAPETVPPDVLLVDTTGELQHLYAAADVIFVGKSLDARGGQNPIEPAALGRPVVVGPHMQNFSEVVSDLFAANAIIRVGNASELERQLIDLLQNPEKRRQLGERAAATVQAYRGAIDRTAQRLGETTAFK